MKKPQELSRLEEDLCDRVSKRGMSRRLRESPQMRIIAGVYIAEINYPSVSCPDGIRLASDTVYRLLGRFKYALPREEIPKEVSKMAREYYCR